DGNEGRSTYSLPVGVTMTGNPTITNCVPNLTNVQVNRPVQFSATAMDPGQMSMTFAWTFTDGASAMGSTVTHAFATAGTFTATVVATTSDSRVSAPCSKMVTVTPPQDYTGTWILSPSGNFTGTCPFSVSFPTASI